MGFIIFLLICTTCMQLILAARQFRFLISWRQADLLTQKLSAEYNMAKLKMNMIDWLFSIGFILLWLYSDGIIHLDELISLNNIPILKGLLLLSAIFLPQQLLRIALNFWRTFGVEEKYNFNRMSHKAFLVYSTKRLALNLLLFLTLAFIFLAIYLHTQVWWLWNGIIIFIGLFFIQYIYPSIITPFFYQLKKFDDAQLESQLKKLLHENGFSFQGIYLINASRYSSHGNAHVVGLSKQKSIFIFDTLLNSLSIPELAAVIAHELGHIVYGHLMKSIFVQALLITLMLWIVSWFVTHPIWWFPTFPNLTSVGILAVIYLLVPVYQYLTLPIMNLLSRHGESSADAFAGKAGYVPFLIQALTKLTQQNAGLDGGDPWYSAWYYSHPSLVARINALEKSVMLNAGKSV